MENCFSQTLTTIMLLLAAFLAITPTIESLCSDTMAITLSSSGFTLFAQALHASNLTINSTTRLPYLAPQDNALINSPFDAESIGSHVSNTRPFPYQSLLTIPTNASLPTLRNTTQIVGTDGESVSFNDVLVIVPNLHVDGSCAVHGVNGPLVPIPTSSSSVDDAQDFPKQRMETKPSPVSTRRRIIGTFKGVCLIDSPRNHPTPVRETGNLVPLETFVDP